MVKCSECGFLSLRNRFTRLLDEAEQSYRDTGKVTDVPRTRPVDPNDWITPRSEPLHEEMPICFENVLSFRPLAYDKAKAKDSGRTDANYRGSMSDGGWDVTEGDFQEVLAEERDCPRWTEWHQGSTPKEHREMVDRDHITEREDRRDQSQKERQEGMAQQAQEHQQRIAREVQEWQARQGRIRLRWEILVFGILVVCHS